MIDYTATMQLFCQAHNLPMPEAEYRFHKTRKWRMDFAWPAQKLAIEIMGGIYQQGRHTRGAGYENDMQKFNAAQIADWKILQYTPRQIRAGEWVEDVKMILEAA